LDQGGHQTIDPFVGLAFAAAATSTIRLLTYLTVLPYRNPFLMAKAAATLDRLSGGRLILGVGTGYQKSEFYALGVNIDERNALFDEALEVLPLAWSGQAFSYEGIHFSARDVIAKPVPAQNPIPIWIGGNSQLTLRRVASRAQGWMPLGGTPLLAQTSKTAHIASRAELRSKIEQVRRDAGQRPIDVVHGYPMFRRGTTRADFDRHRREFEGLGECGVNWLVIEAPHAEPTEVADWVRWFGNTTISQA
jgi:probable F420-dependent oxidoreductase